MTLWKDLDPGAEINARTTDLDAGIDGLARSIAANGLIMPIAVRTVKVGRKKVQQIVDGRRRYSAIGLMIERGDLPETYDIPTREVDAADDAAAKALSLAANVERLPLHPVDQYEAFRSLADAGMGHEAIAGRFALTLRQVGQVLALGGLHPEIRAAWRARQIGEDVARAFASELDQTHQLAVFNKLRGNVFGMSSWGVRSALRAVQPYDVQVRLRAVGRDAYVAAGGVITPDLFEEREETVSDYPLLCRLAAEKIEGDLTRLRTLGFVAIDTTDPRRSNLMWRDYIEDRELTQTSPENVDEEDDEVTVGDAVEMIGQRFPEGREAIGILVDMTYGGMVYRAFHAEALDREGSTPASPSKPEGEREKDPAEISQALKIDAKKWRTLGFQRAFADDPAALFRLMVVAGGSTYCTVFQSGARPTGALLDWKEHLPKVPESSAIDHIREVARLYSKMVTTDEYTAMEGDVAYLAGMLDAVSLREFLVEVFTDHAEEFFSRVNAAVAEAAMAEIGVGMPPKKKAERVAYATDKARAAGWLPKILRLGMPATAPGWVAE